MDSTLFFRKFTEQAQALRPDVGQQRTLLGVSGGLDSVVLAHLWHRTGWPFAIAHAHFGLRGADSDADAVFVEALARELEVPFFIKRFDTASYATAQGISTQMAARQLRYEWWNALRTEEGFRYLATAHHRDDNVETVLYNFSRGTGLPGMAGISPIEGHLMRPLLWTGRAELSACAHAAGYRWREDKSNAEDHYRRNFIRHHLIPLFEDLNPAFSETAGRNIERLRSAEANLYALLSLHFGHTGQDTPSVLDKQRLLQLPAPAEALRLLLRPFGFNAEQARQTAEHLEETGFEISSDTHRLLLDRATLEVLPSGESALPEVLIHADDLMVRLPEGGSLFFMPASPGSAFPDGKISIRVSGAALHYPLKLRTWRSGDIFQPFGMNGQHQRLQDYFVNQKLSVAEKSRVRILEDYTGKVIWIVGYRLDERFRVLPEHEALIDIHYIQSTQSH
jgi:tRNA(Ile)-lysidine synthase